MSDSVMRRLRRSRALALTLGCVLGTVGVAGCGSGAPALAAVDEVTVPSWFTDPVDRADDGADPPRWTRRYAKLPRAQSDVELAYSQALDRAGWRFRASAADCADAGAPKGGRISDNCWIRDGLVLAFTARHDRGGTDGRPPSALEVVLHERAESGRRG